MPRKILNKIIRHLDSNELESFILDRQSGELCYLAKEKGKIIKIPNNLCQDFFSAVENALTNNHEGEKLFCLFSSRGKINITLRHHFEDGKQKISAEIEKTEKLIGFTQIGFDLKQQKQIKTALKQKKGLIIAGLPAGNGLSNLINSLAAEINLEEKSAYLLSNANEYKIDGLNFIQLEYPFENDLRTKLAWLEKKDAEIIIIPEIYERQTALALAKLANSGHLILAGCRSRDAFSVLNSFLKAGPTREILANFLLIISGRQIHRLCPHCAEKYSVNNTEIQSFAKRFSLQKKITEALIPKRLIRSIGCPKCHYRAYTNKIGLFETLTFNKELRSCQNISEIRQKGFDQGFQPLIIKALSAAKNGLISLQEILSLKL